MPAISAAALSRRPERPPAAGARARAQGWWPLAALTLLAAALRLSTLHLQSLWYDEAFTPVHVLHASLIATLRSVVHTENSPPLWYVVEWAGTRVLGTGEVALRLPSALAGVATVPVAWAIARQLAGRRAGLLCAALVAANPLFVWYSQEARVYALFVLAAAVATLCFVRADADPTPRRVAAFALSGAVALATHYFAVFLLAPMALWLAREPLRRRRALPALAALALVGAALLPLILAQGGHGTQWIGRWPLSQRLQAIPQYYLVGYSGAPLGHGVELLVALVVLVAVGLGLWQASEPRAAQPGARETTEPRALRGAGLMLGLAAVAIVTPVALAALGADYLAPRNLVAAMLPLTVGVAVLVTAPGHARASAAATLGALSAVAIVLAFAALSVDVDLSPRLQRGDWRGVARALGRSGPARAITTVELGAAPLEYYLPGLRSLRRGRTALVQEIDETGYAPLRSSAGAPPSRGFRLLARLDVHGLIVYRFRASVPRAVPEAALRKHVITLARPEVLVQADARTGA